MPVCNPNQVVERTIPLGGLRFTLIAFPAILLARLLQCFKSLPLYGIVVLSLLQLPVRNGSSFCLPLVMCLFERGLRCGDSLSMLLLSEQPSDPLWGFRLGEYGLRRRRGERRRWRRHLEIRARERRMLSRHAETFQIDEVVDIERGGQERIDFVEGLFESSVPRRDLREPSFLTEAFGFALRRLLFGGRRACELRRCSLGPSLRLLLLSNGCGVRARSGALRL